MRITCCTALKEFIVKTSPSSTTPSTLASSRTFFPFRFLGKRPGRHETSAPQPSSSRDVSESKSAPRPAHLRPATVMTAEQPEVPPTKASLKAWWQHFTSAQKSKAKEPDKGAWAPRAGNLHRQTRRSGVEEHTVFGKPLKESLKYASVQISTANANGELYVWGYIPVVVAKCGLFLKENATEVEGTFRVNGSNKRMRDLQAMFEARPRYGKSLDWKKESYTTHDVASMCILLHHFRSLNMLEQFRDAIAKKPYNQEEVIATYKRLIHSMPRANQYLLLYVLDLLSVFARKSDKNLMTAKNLAVIFRPGIMSHPQHELTPREHQLSQEVLEFLIAHQDWFMLDIPPPPRSARADPAGEEVDDMGMMSSSDEDPATAGGWKLVGGPSEGERRRIARRRTTTERERERQRTDADRDRGGGGDAGLPPVHESPVRCEGSPGVTRSRTLPSTRSGRSSHREGQAAGTDDERQGRPLRKVRRSSAQPKRTPHNGPATTS
ncbi:hypothetical protein EW146_g7044 [Bondarzewia mesenterica]|uniref:Rho-GAP domain-containing protein n=1 Tax=Bondarzewia mesenterica TaxID=1095465 RepID=A0A4V3XED2_9AGAM|nr:hypothetical protein EW146_g7044 [Bondarzewia mesenterica]